MVQCEYRINSGHQVKVTGREMSVAASVKPNQAICKVKAEVLDQRPICELPKASTETCPIAQFKQRKINLEETNKQLTAIFEAEKNQQPPTPRKDSFSIPQI
jgi:hypothetical protein